MNIQSQDVIFVTKLKFVVQPKLCQNLWNNAFLSIIRLLTYAQFFVIMFITIFLKTRYKCVINYVDRDLRTLSRKKYK